MKTTYWEIDPAHSEIHFKIKHLVISTVTGAFRIFRGTLETNDQENFNNARIGVSIDTYSIDTNETDRDEHLKSAEFFDADTYPEIRLASTSFTHKKGDEYELIADLTLKGVTKKVTLQVLFGGELKDGFGRYRAGFEVNGTIKRHDFGIVYDGITEGGGLVLSEDVKIAANIQFVKKE
ncbi:YceI family protein [Flavobacterium sp. MAH-1]|uniref:YceI family protein n=1 Tax=Flavobacterium agri TaxID=2743471 RepID=A0A7Y8Y3R1_9FLAO|nr:YceI family protein [Flavobacterium agri]NUY81999.1 YceI family protein [Flavobacterium agri]NYA72023.1 YceI family protein [Flavobacterium agri]